MRSDRKAKLDGGSHANGCAADLCPARSIAGIVGSEVYCRLELALRTAALSGQSLLCLTLEPPVLVRCWNETPLPGVTTIIACFEPALKVSPNHHAGFGPHVRILDARNLRDDFAIAGPRLIDEMKRVRGIPDIRTEPLTVKVPFRYVALPACPTLPMSTSDHGDGTAVAPRSSSCCFIGVSRVTIRVGGAHPIEIRCRCGGAVIAIRHCVSCDRRDLRVSAAAPGLPFQQEGGFVR